MTVPAYFEIIPGITTYAKIKDIVQLKLFSKLWPWPDMILYNIYIAFIVIPNIGLRVEGQGRGTRGVLL